MGRWKEPAEGESLSLPRAHPFNYPRPNLTPTLTLTGCHLRQQARDRDGLPWPCDWMERLAKRVILFIMFTPVLLRDTV